MKASLATTFVLMPAGAAALGFLAFVGISLQERRIADRWPDYAAAEVERRYGTALEIAFGSEEPARHPWYDPEAMDIAAKDRADVKRAIRESLERQRAARAANPILRLAAEAGDPDVKRRN